MPDLARTRTELVVIQATSLCNVNCCYCYLPDRSSTSSAHDLTPLERIVRLRELGQWKLVDELCSVSSDDDDDVDDWSDWSDWSKILK